MPLPKSTTSSDTPPRPGFQLVLDSKFEGEDYFHWAYANYFEKKGREKNLFSSNKLLTGLSGNRSKYSLKRCVVCKELMGFKKNLATPTPVLTVPIEKLPAEIGIRHVPTSNPAPSYSHCELNYSHCELYIDPLLALSEEKIDDLKRYLFAHSQVDWLEPMDGCGKCNSQPLIKYPLSTKLWSWLRATTLKLYNQTKEIFAQSATTRR